MGSAPIAKAPHQRRVLHDGHPVVEPLGAQDVEHDLDALGAAANRLARVARPPEPAAAAATNAGANGRMALAETICDESLVSSLSLVPCLEAERGRGYTRGMKTAVSVPHDLFAQVDRLAKRSRRSRSEVYSAALREYVARHAPDEVTSGLDAVIAGLGRSE